MNRVFIHNDIALNWIINYRSGLIMINDIKPLIVHNLRLGI